MKKYAVSLLLIMLLLLPVTVGAEEQAVRDAAPAAEAVEPLDEDVQDDTMIDIQPLGIGMSAQERQQENSTAVDFISNVDKLPDLSCDNVRLQEQVESFIYRKISEKSSSSAVERRNRVLLVRNLHHFTEITQENIKRGDGFSVQAALMNLRINQNREIAHICVSQGNQYNKFKNVYLIIYPFANFYKIVVANLLDNVDDLDSATFVYNW